MPALHTHYEFGQKVLNKLNKNLQKEIKLSKNTFYSKTFDKRLLNKNKSIWHHPNNTNETYNYSFKELYDISLKICIKLNNEAYKILHDKKDINIFLNNIKLINLKNIPKLLK